jgi:hypothetical protein
MNMLDLIPGDTWRAPTGRIFDVIDRAFIYAGKRYIAAYEHGVDYPMLYSVAHLEDLAIERVAA